MFSNDVQEKISLAVIKVLLSRFESFPEDGEKNRNAPFHEAFLQAFTHKMDSQISDVPSLISLSSWLHGLSTSLGASFFERVAHILSGGEKKAFTKKKKTLLEITRKQQEVISDIMSKLKKGDIPPSSSNEQHILENASLQGDKIEADDITIDVFWDDGKKIVAIELKTVKPNSGIMRDEKRQILETRSAFSLKYPNKEIDFYIGFPFDPYSPSPTESDKDNFLKMIIGGEKYFALDEVLLANELWDFLSSEENAMQEILNIINIIATPKFMQNYLFLDEPKNRENVKQYKELLKEWFLFSELELLENINVKNLSKKMKKTYNQSMFDGGSYKWERHGTLMKLSPKTYG